MIVMINCECDEWYFPLINRIIVEPGEHLKIEYHHLKDSVIKSVVKMGWVA